MSLPFSQLITNEVPIAPSDATIRGMGTYRDIAVEAHGLLEECVQALLSDNIEPLTKPAEPISNAISTSAKTRWGTAEIHAEASQHSCKIDVGSLQIFIPVPAAQLQIPDLVAMLQLGSRAARAVFEHQAGDNAYERLRSRAAATLLPYAHIGAIELTAPTPWSKGKAKLLPEGKSFEDITETYDGPQELMVAIAGPLAGSLGAERRTPKIKLAPMVVRLYRSDIGALEALRVLSEQSSCG